MVDTSGRSPVAARTQLRADIVEVALSDLEPAVLAEVYHRLLAPAFRPAELMTLAEMREAYGANGTDPSAVMLSGGTPVAVMLGEWYVQGQVLLLAYLSVDKATRSSGLGEHLVRDVLPGWLEGSASVLVLAEVDDPRSWPGSEGTGNPNARLRFYDRQGARVLPVRYFQPSLRLGSPRGEGMLLLRLDWSPGLSSDLLGAFLEEYFTFCEGPKSLADPRVAALVASARSLELDRDASCIDRWAQDPTPD